MPVSSTATVSASWYCPCSRSNTCTDTSPCWVNLTALLIKLDRTCRSRVGSAQTCKCSTPAGQSSRSCNPFWLAKYRKLSTQLSNNSTNEKYKHSSSKRPLSTREKSRISLITSSK